MSAHMSDDFPVAVHLFIGCVIDCHEYPDQCIGEKLIKSTADRMAADGYLVGLIIANLRILKTRSLS